MFSRLIESLKSSLNQNRNKAISHRAEETFQIKEVLGELWFTHYGEPFCPCSMMKDEPISVLKTLRQLYVSLYE